MKKLFNLLIVLLILYFGIEISFIKLNKGHELEYKIKSDKKTFHIKEIYKRKRKNEIDNYYFEIKVDDIVFNYQTYKNYKGKNYIIKDINYFSNDNYKCINLTNRKEAISDVICIKDNIEYFYNMIKGNDKELDDFVSNLKIHKKYTNNLKNKIDADPVTLYLDNLIDKHYLSLQNYKGLYLINKKNKIKQIDLFKNDIYTNKINTVMDKYYITADYNEDYKFHTIKLVNLKNGKKSNITIDNAISLDSYIEGYIKDDFYLFDRSDKKQYRINIKNKTISISGDKSKGIVLYRNDKFYTGSAYDAFDMNTYFSKYLVDSKLNGEKYTRVDKVGNKLSGYYYLYLKNDNKYDIYRVNVQNKKIKTYLFTTTDINDIYYYKDYIYFKDGLYVKYYQDDLGIKTLLKDNEIEFNNSIKFGLFVD